MITKISIFIVSLFISTIIIAYPPQKFLTIPQTTLVQQTNSIKGNQYQNISVSEGSSLQQPSIYALNQKEDNRKSTKVNLNASNSPNYHGVYIDFAL